MRVTIRERAAEDLWLKPTLKRCVFRFLRNEDRRSDDFHVVWNSYEMLGTAREKARLSRLSLVMGTESGCVARVAIFAKEI